MTDTNKTADGIAYDVKYHIYYLFSSYVDLKFQTFVSVKERDNGMLEFHLYIDNHFVNTGITKYPFEMSASIHYAQNEISPHVAITLLPGSGSIKDDSDLQYMKHLNNFCSAIYHADWKTIIFEGMFAEKYYVKDLGPMTKELIGECEFAQMGGKKLACINDAESSYIVGTKKTNSLYTYVTDDGKSHKSRFSSIFPMLKFPYKVIE